jgi:cytochrome P450
MSVPTATAQRLEDLLPLQDPAFYRTDIDVVHEALTEARAQAPVFWHERGGFWVLLKHADQRYVGSNPDIFSSKFGFQIADTFPLEVVAPQLPGWAQEQLRAPGLTRAEQRGIIARAKTSIGDPEIESVVVTDPPRHLQHRKLMTNALSPRLVRGLGPRLTEIIDEALDAVTPGETIEFVEAVTKQIPPRVMSSLLDVPKEDTADFIMYAEAFLASVILNVDDPEEAARNKRLAKAFSDYITALVAERRTNPGDDLVSGIVGGQLDGAPVPDKIAMMLVRSLIGGGSDTTRHLLSLSTQALAEHPDQRAILRERPELIPNAVQEILRWCPLVWSEARTAVQDVELRGQEIKAGDFLVKVFPSANRDEESWERPFEFDVTRQFSVPTMAFGWGEHHCPGNPLARTEAQIFIERMLARFGDWEVLGTPERFTSSFINGLTRMDVRF